MQAPVGAGSSLRLVLKSLGRSARPLFPTTPILKAPSVPSSTLPKDSFHSLHFIWLSEPGAQQLHIKVPPVGGEASVSLLICPVPVCNGHRGIPETDHGATWALALHRETQLALQSSPLIKSHRARLPGWSNLWRCDGGSSSHTGHFCLAGSLEGGKPSIRAEVLNKHGKTSTEWKACPVC